MARLPFTAGLAMALAACGPSSEQVDASEPEIAGASSVAEAGPPAAPQSLVGEYRVAGIDGEALDAQFGIAVSIDPEEIELAPCAGLVWNYTYANGKLETRHSRQPEGGIVCRITREVQAAGEAIDRADSARRTEANGIELAGGGHSILLFSQ